MEAKDFFSMTPRQIHLLLSAHISQMARAQMERHFLVRSMALAIHAPERLPPPPTPSIPLEDMTDDQIKQRLLAWRGKENSP